MDIFIKRISAIIIILTIAVYGCSSIDLSTPEKNVESLYYAISKKDSGLYAKCFYEHGELTTSQIKLGAEHVFEHMKTLRYKVIQRDEVSPNEVNLKIEEVSQRKNGLKILSTSLVRHIKVGKEWKILDSKNIELRKIE